MPRTRLRLSTWIAAAVAGLFLAYVVGRAVGILTGIGPYPTEALAIAVMLVLLWRRRPAREA